LNIIAAANKSSPNKLIGITELLQQFYETYGRSFFSRYDYEEVPSEGANALVAQNGTGEEQPNIDINADLRLDLPSETTAHITTGYQFFRESTDDPNAISGASKQSGVNQFDGGRRYPPEAIREALDLAPTTPLTVCDARDQTSSIKALIVLVEHLTSRPVMIR